ncbi:MAG: thiolase family protein, partial [Dehalococcoidia bacterium]|nr:thiolase family protein [Dehalococcoidia bacterium]
ITEKTGALPVNPSGGRVACGHVASVSDLMSSCSVILQLREEAPGIQVPIKRGRGLVEGIDGIAALSAVTVFERDR